MEKTLRDFIASRRIPVWVNPLFEYDEEVQRGLIHTSEYDQKMKELWSRYESWKEILRWSTLTGRKK